MRHLGFVTCSPLFSPWLAAVEQAPPFEIWSAISRARGDFWSLWPAVSRPDKLKLVCTAHRDKHECSSPPKHPVATAKIGGPIVYFDRQVVRNAG